ncbi:right-handed parallel beta-helix repeat-containing protein, partial [Candidatus Binatia bacterium]|nr:right-handed parallel beta-helix repeat-containing protein [Candidatus Binatia bacterium]
MHLGTARARHLVLLLSCALASALPTAARAATFDVASGDVAGLIAAIDAANANGEADTIHLAAGTYSLTSGPYGGAGLPAITTEIALVGADAATTVIERAPSGPGGPQFRLLTTSSPAGVRIANLTLHRGTTAVANTGKLKIEDCILSANGSGVMPGGELEVEGTTITGSTSLAYPGAAIVGGLVTVRSSQIVGNAGIAVQNVATLRLLDSLVQGNQYGIVVATGYPSSSSFIEIVRSTIDGQSQTGIELRNFYQDPIVRAVITDSTISNNAGGGIALLGGTENSDKRELVVRRSTISGNSTTGDGGGIFIEGASVAPGGLAAVTIDSSTISGNHADGSGGAIFIAGGLRGGRRLQVIRSTITDNTADADANGSGDGGGIVTPLRVVDVEDSILAGNTDAGGEAPDCVGALTSLGHNVLGSTSGCGIAVAASDTVGAPLLGALAANGGPTMTHLPLAGSPALDAADPARCGAPDQRGLL